MLFYYHAIVPDENKLKFQVSAGYIGIKKKPVCKFFVRCQYSTIQSP